MRRARRWDRLRVLAFILLVLALFLPELVRAQVHDIDVPAGPVVNPIYPATSRYYLDSTYDRWWHEVADCEGVPLPDIYQLVRYVLINYAYFDLPADDPAPPGSGILGHSFVAEWQMFIAIPYRYDPEVVKHEMMHFLLYWARRANGGHPAMYFNGRCGFFASYVGLRTASSLK